MATPPDDIQKLEGRYSSSFKPSKGVRSRGLGGEVESGMMNRGRDEESRGGIRGTVVVVLVKSFASVPSMSQSIQAKPSGALAALRITLGWDIDGVRQYPYIGNMGVECLFIHIQMIYE